MRVRQVTVAILTVLIWAGNSYSQEWVAPVRKLVAEKRFPEALQVVNQRVASNPADMEALGWRGRVQAWSGNWADAERDYRAVLQAVPREAEILLALADVLSWQQRFADALETVQRAEPLVKGAPLEVEAVIRRARLLRALARPAEAREAFQVVLQLDPRNAEASNALKAVRPLRHSLNLGFDNDRFNFTGAAQACTIALRSDWNSQWISVASISFFNRFGEKPVRGFGALTYRATKRDSLTAGGAGADHRGILAKGEAFFDYGRGIRISETAPVRGLEINYAQRWLWFRDARILALSPSVVFYLPRDWMFTVQATAARSRFAGTGTEWRPNGQARVSFPVRPRLRLNTFFAVGTENFSRVDQIGRFSARTWGGGARWEFAPRQDVSFYGLFQDRSQSRTQTSFGVNYGFRF